jgi:glycyl-tRNA synthetase (class II)
MQISEKAIQNMNDILAQIKNMEKTTKRQRDKMANLVRTAFINGFMVAAEEQTGISDTDEIAMLVESSKTVQRVIYTIADSDTVNGL